MLLQRLFREEPVIKSSSLNLNVRLLMFGAAWVNVCVAAVMILPIDMSQDEDPKIRAYSRLKWRFITAWFNCINLGYFPLCMYCDWKEKKGEENERFVNIVRRVRDIIFTSILFPTVLWADFCFWRLYIKDYSLITTPRLFEYISAWGQHSLHTVSLVMAVADLLLIPRRRPESLKSRILLMTAFFVLYCLVILERYRKGEMVYALLGTFSRTEGVVFVLMCYVEYLLYFSIQWFIIKFLWGERETNIDTKVR